MRIFGRGLSKYVEHFTKSIVSEETDVEYFYSNFPYDQPPRHIFDLVPDSSDTTDGRCLAWTEYLLPSEIAGRGLGK